MQQLKYTRRKHKQIIKTHQQNRKTYVCFLCVSVCFMFFSKLFCVGYVYLWFVVCFRLVYLSCCIYNRTTHIKTRPHKKLREKHKTHTKQTKQNKHRNSLFPSRNLRDIYSRRFVGWISCISVVLCCCFSRSFSVCCLFLYVCFLLCLCFRLVCLSFCLNTMQYTTLNTNKLEMGLCMTCVKCSKQCSNSFQIT